MRNLSWSAVLAALLAGLALVLAAVGHEADALAVALVAITFALLSHRDA